MEYEQIGNRETPNGIVRVSFTYNCPDGYCETEFSTTDETKLRTWLDTNPNITNYAFQEERGETGRLHYQGFLKLAKRKRIDQLGSECIRNGMAIHFSPTSRAGNTDAEFYCIKENTRTRGPWFDGDYIQPDYSTFTEPRGWQLPLWNMINGAPIERKLFWVWEPSGGVGKSTFTKYCGWKKKAMKIVLASADNLLSLVIKSKPVRAYILDLPRTCENENMRSTYQALEEIKGQYITSTKYEGGSKMLPMIPHMIIFSNYAPTEKDRKAFSHGRWVILKIIDNALLQEDGSKWYGDISHGKRKIDEI